MPEPPDFVRTGFLDAARVTESAKNVHLRFTTYKKIMLDKVIKKKKYRSRHSVRK